MITSSKLYHLMFFSDRNNIYNLIGNYVVLARTEPGHK